MSTFIADPIEVELLDKKMTVEKVDEETGDPTKIRFHIRTIQVTVHTRFGEHHFKSTLRKNQYGEPAWGAWRDDRPGESARKSKTFTLVELFVELRRHGGIDGAVLAVAQILELQGEFVSNE